MTIMATPPLARAAWKAAKRAMGLSRFLRRGCIEPITTRLRNTCAPRRIGESRIG